MMKQLLLILVFITLTLAMDNFGYKLEKGEQFVVTSSDITSNKTNLDDVIFYKKFSSKPYTGKGVLITKYTLFKANFFKGKIQKNLEFYSYPEGILQAKFDSVAELVEQEINTKATKEIFASSDIDDITRSYLKLYEDEFFNYSKATQNYLINNISNIGKSVQTYLRYPRIAIKTKQQGMSIAEFYLDSDGTISNLRTVISSGHLVLDKNTLKTIKLAKGDFLLPKEKTLIKLYVYYQLR